MKTTKIISLVLILFGLIAGMGMGLNEVEHSFYFLGIFILLFGLDVEKHNSDKKWFSKLK